MSKDDKAIFYHKPQTFQWTPANGVFSFGENRKEQNMIRYYSVPKETFVTNGTIVEPLNVTENGTYAPPAGTAYSPVVVNVEGGGGSSDFSTAEVTITGVGTIIAPFYDSESGITIGGSHIPPVTEVVILGSNGAGAYADNNSTITSVSGNATLEGDIVTITGDCSIVLAEA